MLTLIAVVAGVVAVIIAANWRLEFFKWDLKDELNKTNNTPTPSPAPVVEEAKEQLIDVNAASEEIAKIKIEDTSEVVKAKVVPATVKKPAARKPGRKKTAPKK